MKRSLESSLPSASLTREITIFHPYPGQRMEPRPEGRGPTGPGCHHRLRSARAIPQSILWRRERSEGTAMSARGDREFAPNLAPDRRLPAWLIAAVLSDVVTSVPIVARGIGAPNRGLPADSPSRQPNHTGERRESWARTSCGVRLSTQTKTGAKFRCAGGRNFLGIRRTGRCAFASPGLVSRRRYATTAEAIAGHEELVRTGTTALGQACCKHGALPAENCVVCLPPQRPTLVHELQTNQGVYATSKRVSRVRVADVMTRNVVCVEQSLSVEALTSLFLERGFSAAPVVDDNGRPVGVVSKTDLLREVQDRADTEERVPDRRVGRREERVELGLGFQITRLARATVGEIMTPIPLTLSEDAPLSEAATRITLGG